MKRTLLAVSIQFAIGSLYAAEVEGNSDVNADVASDSAVADVAGAEVATTATEQVAPAVAVSVPSPAVAPVQDVQINKDETKALAPKAGSQAAEALQKQEGDASAETNLQEVFTSNERQYSLIKKGEFSTFYDLDLCTRQK